MRKVYFIGVCGTAMATVAVLLKERGLEVRGPDEPTARSGARSASPTNGGAGLSWLTGRVSDPRPGEGLSGDRREARVPSGAEDQGGDLELRRRQAVSGDGHRGGDS